MKFSNRIEKGIYVLAPEGNLTGRNTEKLYAYISASLGDHTIHGFVINFKKVIYLDSTGIGALAFLFKKYQKHDIELVLCEPNNVIQEMFESAQMDQIFRIYSSEEEALRSFDVPPKQ